ncbi:GNAT family N-acetyltransferase [Goekera deserti]|uniref:GNAT family N-acetyltransferase n=1 Tax=Goekera deserti TaxID=2497753 RepID=UPI0022A76A33|nr:GNAT family N-acetyltransferase [Goekera deserti]
MQPRHWPVEVALAADPDVVRWTMYPAGLDEAGARARIADLRERVERRQAGRYVVTGPDGAAAGTAGIVAGRRGAPEVFYALLPAARGRGLATAAATLLTRWATGAGHELLLLMTLLGNVASEAVAHRAGYVRATVEEVVDPDGAVVRLRRWEHRRIVPVP